MNMAIRTHDDFACRVNHAARVMIEGRRTNRNFDSCFEMYDGDEVVVALWRRAQKNPRLLDAIQSGRYLCEHAMQSAIKSLEGVSNLAEHAAQTRARNSA
jgi:hypothetical protein